MDQHHIIAYGSSFEQPFQIIWNKGNVWFYRLNGLLYHVNYDLDETVI